MGWLRRRGRRPAIVERAARRARAMPTDDLLIAVDSAVAEIGRNARRNTPEALYYAEVAWSILLEIEERKRR